MSDTPRTEAVNQYLRTRRDYTKTDHEVWMNHGIQLERELNAANESFRKLNIHALDLVTRIKRLEDENNELRAEEAHLLNAKEELKRRIKRLEETGDYLCAAAAFMGWHDKIEDWTKAKEAKP